MREQAVSNPQNNAQEAVSTSGVHEQAKGNSNVSNSQVGTQGVVPPVSVVREQGNANGSSLQKGAREVINLAPAKGPVSKASQAATEALRKREQRVSGLFLGLDFELMSRAISSLWHYVARVLRLSK